MMERTRFYVPFLEHSRERGGEGDAASGGFVCWIVVSVRDGFGMCGEGKSDLLE